jgi:DNA-binding MarR family transcriptional regulator/N-acetylglutamate synthase-like GNAT family acetyltransferase
MVMTPVPSERIDAVRGFNRFYTTLIGVVSEGLVGTPYSLTEARLIFELAQREVSEVTALRRTLDLDAGYLSRILSRFDADGLVHRERAPDDARRQVARLTGRGREVYRDLDARSGAQIGRILSALPEEDQRRLVGAMEAIEGILGDQGRPPSYVLRPLVPGDFGWVIHRHGALYAAEYGWDATFEALVARVVADHVERQDARSDAWIAEVDGEPAGCVFCVQKSERVAQLRLLLVEPSARGMGIGARLVEECVRFARRTGYDEMVLWTNDVLSAARRIYQRAGFELTDEGRHHAFGHDLVEQNWRLKL